LSRRTPERFEGAPGGKEFTVELVGPPPSAAEIDTLLTVASRVPDHGKLAPWRFIVFEGEARRTAGEAIAAAFRAKYPDAKPEHIAAERRASGARATRDRRSEPRWPACENPRMGAGAVRRCRRHEPCPRCARAHGANWITEWYACNRSVLDAFGLAPHERIAGFIHIGRGNARRRGGGPAVPRTCCEGIRWVKR
jgi:nitroreductase